MLRHTEKQGGEQAWWRSEQQTPASGSAGSEARYDLETVQGVIARAAELQAAHQQTLSVNEIESVAAEVGVDAAFVRQALAEQKRPAAARRAARNVSVAAPHSPTTFAERAVLGGAGAAYAMVNTLAVLNLTSQSWAPFFLIVLPVALTFAVGTRTRHPLTGAKAGALLAAGGVAGLIFGSMIQTGWQSPPPDAYRICAAIIAGGAVAGAAGSVLAAWGRTRRGMRVRESRAVVEP